MGRDCVLGHHVVVGEGCQIGDRVRIDDHAVIGKLPMRAANTAVTREQAYPATVIESEVLIGTGVIIYVGTHIGRSVLIADLATVREDVTIGAYTIVGRGVAIENECEVGSYCKLETNVYITAYSRLENRVFVAPGAITTNDNFVGRTKERFKHFKGVTVKKGGRIGANATILPGKTIGEDSLVAAGSVVTYDTPPRQVVMGAPAKAHGAVPEAQLLENQGWEQT
jgi:acetyltransferase-like isoleucine patch superfamily enzyme